MRVKGLEFIQGDDLVIVYVEYRDHWGWRVSNVLIKPQGKFLDGMNLSDLWAENTMDRVLHAILGEIYEQMKYRDYLGDRYMEALENGWLTIKPERSKL